MNDQLLFPGLAPEVRRSATIDPTGQYRYHLGRAWGEPEAGFVNWIMLNPSTGDDRADDATIRRCVRFTRGWGYGALAITNLFAYRSADPQALFTPGLDVVGPENDVHLANTALAADRVVLAWGCHGHIRGRAAAVIVQLARLDVRCDCLGLTLDGEPKHPLYLPAATEPRPFDLRRAAR